MKGCTMLRTITVTFGLLMLAATGRAAPRLADEPASPKEQYERLVQEHEDGATPRELAARFLELAQKHPRDPAALDALVWVLTKLRSRPEAARALEHLETDHLKNEKLADACPAIARTFSTRAEKLLQAALEKSPHKKVRAQACWSWAALLKQQATIVEQLKTEPESADRVVQYYGSDYGKHLTSLDGEKLERQREQVYERLLKTFADEPVGDSTMGAEAEKGLFQIRHLSIGRSAAEIAGEDIFGKPFKLSDYRGKVVVLSFWGHW